MYIYGTAAVCRSYSGGRDLEKEVCDMVESIIPDRIYHIF